MPTHAQVLVAPPTFSVPHGLYNTPFELVLSSTTPGAQIYYTLDSSTPSISNSKINGITYTQAIPISDTTIVRAVAYLAPTDKSAPATQSYIFLQQVLQQPAKPSAGWPTNFAAKDADGGPYPADYEMDPEIVRHPSYSDTIESVFRTLPTLSIVTDPPNLWDKTSGIYAHPDQKGAAWERPASIEWIDPTGQTAGFSENAGVRMHGQASRRPHRTPKKTFRFYFTAQYGNTKLDYKLFEDLPNELGALSKFDRILVRAGSNRSWPYFDQGQRAEADYINDEFVRRAFLEMGWLAPHGTYVHAYLNGLYWGLYNVTERIDDRFLVGYEGLTPFDYDLIVPAEENGYDPTPDAGTLDAWNQLHALLKSGKVSDALYEQVKQRLDVVNLADYMILMHYIANTDWPAHNWYAWRKRTGPDTRFRMMPWDSDTGLRNLGEDLTKANLAGTPTALFHKLISNAEFRQLVQDRFYKLIVNQNGALSPKRCAERYGELAATIDPAIIGESARWGDYVRDLYAQARTSVSKQAFPAYLHSRDLPAKYTDPQKKVNDASQMRWVDVRDYKLDVYCPQRNRVVINQYRSNGWYQTAVPVPTFSPDGGTVPVDSVLTLSADASSSSEIYYTLDGNDPRLAGGAIAPTAQLARVSTTFTLTQVTTVQARLRKGSVWSPLHEATFYPPQPFANLVINELHYHPLATSDLTGVIDGDRFEFIELYNAGEAPLRLDNAYFGHGINYRFPVNTTLAANSYLVLAADGVQFQTRYGFAAFALYRGSLANSGEGIELNDALGNRIDWVEYADHAPWPAAADGHGESLALCDPRFDNNLPDSWSHSTALDGTPGQANNLPCRFPIIPPTVAIPQPLNGAIYTQGELITILANATDADGVVTKVVFLANGVPIDGCMDSEVPYQCSFAPPPGTYLLTATASDDRQASSTAEAVVVTVNERINLPPVIIITDPISGTTLTANSLLTVRANASDPDGSVSMVQFYANDVALDGCADDSAPYECSFLTSAGLYTLTATVMDNLQRRIPSEPVVVTVLPGPNQPPTVSILQPSTAISVTVNNPVTIEVSAIDADGVISQAIVYLDDKVWCQWSEEPFVCEWTPSTIGSVTLTAQAIDEVGASARTEENGDPASRPVHLQVVKIEAVNPSPTYLLFLPLIEQ